MNTEVALAEVVQGFGRADRNSDTAAVGVVLASELNFFPERPSEGRRITRKSGVLADILPGAHKEAVLNWVGVVYLCVANGCMNNVFIKAMTILGMHGCEDHAAGTMIPVPPAAVPASCPCGYCCAQRGEDGAFKKELIERGDALLDVLLLIHTASTLRRALSIMGAVKCAQPGNSPQRSEIEKACRYVCLAAWVHGDRKFILCINMTRF